MLTDVQAHCVTFLMCLFRPAYTVKAIYQTTAEAKLYAWYFMVIVIKCLFTCVNFFEWYRCSYIVNISKIKWDLEWKRVFTFFLEAVHADVSGNRRKVGNPSRNQIYVLIHFSNWYQGIFTCVWIWGHLSLIPLIAIPIWKFVMSETASEEMIL